MEAQRGGVRARDTLAWSKRSRRGGASRCCSSSSSKESKRGCGSSNLSTCEENDTDTIFLTTMQRQLSPATESGQEVQGCPLYLHWVLLPLNHTEKRAALTQLHCHDLQGC